MAATGEDDDLQIRTPTPAPQGGQHHQSQNHNGRGHEAGDHDTEMGGQEGHGHGHGHGHAHQQQQPPPQPQPQAPPTRTWNINQAFQHWAVDHNRFEVKRLLGKGSYGNVALAIDHAQPQKPRVAIKKIHNVFEVFENAKRIYREINILRRLRHNNIIRIVHISRPPKLRSFKDLYVMFEAMDTDLAKLARDDSQDLTVPHVRWFLYQLLLAVKYMHSAGVIHRDIKPANILLTEQCDLKLCDFGLARGVEIDEGDDPSLAERAGISGEKPVEQEVDQASSNNGANGASGTGVTQGIEPSSAAAQRPPQIMRQMTRHVVTRWYRAPELPLYNDGHYTPAIDVWSIGCCFAEMLGMLPTENPHDRFERKALFPGGSCFPMSRGRDGKMHVAGAARDQLNVIFDVLGSPSEAELGRITSDRAREYLQSLPRKEGIDLSLRYPSAPPDAIDLLKKFLKFHHEDRITVEDALDHPFLQETRCHKAEVSHQGGPLRFRRVDRSYIRDLIVQEVAMYNHGSVPQDWKTRSDEYE